MDVPENQDLEFSSTQGRGGSLAGSEGFRETTLMYLPAEQKEAARQFGQLLYELAVRDPNGTESEGGALRAAVRAGLKDLQFLEEFFGEVVPTEASESEFSQQENWLVLDCSRLSRRLRDIAGDIERALADSAAKEPTKRIFELRGGLLSEVEAEAARRQQKPEDLLLELVSAGLQAGRAPDPLKARQSEQWLQGWMQLGAAATKGRPQGPTATEILASDRDLENP